ncbi:hypothetical protein LUZ61_019655 [Rhynchospora tenuis]|uniref:Uncharacterized protein n=1 Tax=Rhynchospora tenuis TaxID=198213 RepID=A0AAD5ZBI2_9POAL|nr:hypothetical protein LUZ61_019655 [Rhynchospora tenuis]
MNPLTLVKRTQKITSREAALGISDEASWHAKYKDSAYIFVGGLSYDLTEGDLLAVFSQYGEVVDVNLVRDKGTGKSKGFAFLAYEDQRSTVLAVDNLNGAKVSGRIVRVDHVSKYKKKEEEDEENEQEKKEARGVCYAFQKGECNRGASCKFSHQEPRDGDPRWGRQVGDSAWENDKFDDDSHRNKRVRRSSPSAKYRGNEIKRKDERELDRGDDRHRNENGSFSRKDYENERKRKDEREQDGRDDRQRNEKGSSSRYDRDDERDRRYRGRDEERDRRSRHYDRDDERDRRSHR